MRKSRRAARAEALKILYMSDICGEKITGDGLKEVLIKEDISDFTSEIVEGVFKNIEEIDRMLEKFSENWKLSRMSVIDRNILRIAGYEILYKPEISGNITINEAVNLAKKFSGEESGAFINGILDRLAHEVGKITSKRNNENQFSTGTSCKT